MSNTFDLIIVGGGIAGSALGLVMCQRGATVLIVEATKQFRDRVRGEELHPWGFAELQRLGLEDILARSRALPIPNWDTYVQGQLVARRDLVATTAACAPAHDVHHPELQQAMLSAAEEAGATVRRGCRITSARAAQPVEAVLSDGDQQQTLRARLLIIADGRNSSMRTALNIATTIDPPTFCISGLLLAGVNTPASAVSMCMPHTFDALALSIPLSDHRTRLYLVQHVGNETHRYSGNGEVLAMIDHCRRVGVPTHCMDDASQAGPLASFEPACIRLRNETLPANVALIGDAAGTVDPLYGSGMSMALRDVRSLTDALQNSPAHWQQAVAHYTVERRRDHESQLRLEAWHNRLLFAQGAQGDTQRSEVMPRLPELGVDLLGLGPDSATDPRTEAALFGQVR